METEILKQVKGTETEKLLVEGAFTFIPPDPGNPVCPGKPFCTALSPGRAGHQEQGPGFWPARPQQSLLSSLFSKDDELWVTLSHAHCLLVIKRVGARHAEGWGLVSAVFNKAGK